MTKTMEVSVVIPVYNAGRYIEEAVRSALDQKETMEVILVEDGSPDGSLKVCKELEKLDSRVKLFTHPNNENRGPGETRNLALSKASQEWIAFLDADDFFDKNRFRAELDLLKEGNLLDGCYGATGSIFEENMSEEELSKSGILKVTTFKKKIPPERLIYSMLRADKEYSGLGYFSIISLLVNRRVVDDGMISFPVDMYYHQDTFFKLAVAALYKLNAGDIEKPVVYRRVHPENRITKVKNISRTKAIMFAEFEKWCKATPTVPLDISELACDQKVNHQLRDPDQKGKLGIFLRRTFKSKSFVSNTNFFNSGIRSALGNNFLSNSVIKIKEKIQFSAV